MLLHQVSRGQYFDKLEIWQSIWWQKEKFLKIKFFKFVTLWPSQKFFPINFIWKILSAPVLTSSCGRKSFECRAADFMARALGIFYGWRKWRIMKENMKTRLSVEKVKHFNVSTSSSAHSFRWTQLVSGGLHTYFSSPTELLSISVLVF